VLNDAIRKVSDQEILGRDEAKDVMLSILSGHAADIEIAALLIALRTRGEHPLEIAGFLDAMRECMAGVTCADEFAVDLCGTGGDSSGSFNLSTAAALVAAAGGVTVAKHGNRAVSSQCGSADFLDALNISINNDAQTAERELENRNFSFLFAPLFHPAAKTVAPIRKSLGLRTVFNLLGPLANPARVRRQIVGVFDKKWIKPLASALSESGTIHAMVVHGDGGLDEICADGTTYVGEFQGNDFREYLLSPADFGVQPASRRAISGGTAIENAKRFLAVAAGNENELAKWIIVNTAPAFVLSDKCITLREGADRAREIIASGRLSAFLDQIRQPKSR
jgi:anthranilate phosphoribosyltransferase